MSPKHTFTATMVVGAFATYHMGYFSALGKGSESFLIAVLAIVACIILTKFEKK